MSFLVLCIRNDAGIAYAVVSYAGVAVSIYISSRKERVVVFMGSVLVGGIYVE